MRAASKLWGARGPATAAIVCLMIGLASCGAPMQYLGIPLKTGRAEPSLQALALRAMRGNQLAQYQLGGHFENGTIVKRDLKKAARLYAHAAGMVDAPTQALIPMAGTRRTQVQPISAAAQRGLPEAEAALRRLAAIGVNP